MDWSNNRHLWAFYFGLLSICLFIRGLGSVIWYILRAGAETAQLDYYLNLAPSVLDWVIAVLMIPAAFLLFWAAFENLSEKADAIRSVRKAAWLLIALNLLVGLQNVIDVVKVFVGSSDSMWGLYGSSFSLALQVFNILFWGLVIYLFRDTGGMAKNFSPK